MSKPKNGSEATPVAVATEPKPTAPATSTGTVDTFYVDPEELVVDQSPSEALYDDRALEDPPEALVKSIMQLGEVFTPICARPDRCGCGKPHVVYGRKRTLAARKVNKARRAAGMDIVLVPCSFRQGPDAEMLTLLVAENELRTPDNPLNQAKKAKRMLAAGISPENVALAFGVSKQTIDLRLAYLDLAPEAQAELAARNLTQIEAKAMAKATPVEQVAKAGEARKKKEAQKRGEIPLKKKYSPRKQIAKVAHQLSVAGTWNTKVLALLDWVAGDLDAPALIEVLELKIRAKKKATKKEQKEKVNG